VAPQAHDFDKFHKLFAEQVGLGVFEPWMMHSVGPADDDGTPVLRGFFEGRAPICNAA